MLLAVILDNKVPHPIAVFDAPDVLAEKALAPIAVFDAPDKEPSSKAVSPKATLLLPVG